MAALRTQIYLTAEQRAQLDERAVAEGRPLAELIREAVDAYLSASQQAGAAEALAATYGSVPSAEAPPRSEWSDREARVRG
jgi:hypothetical protein